MLGSHSSSSSSSSLLPPHFHWGLLTPLIMCCGGMRTTIRRVTSSFWMPALIPSIGDRSGKGKMQSELCILHISRHHMWGKITFCLSREKFRPVLFYSVLSLQLLPSSPRKNPLQFFQSCSIFLAPPAQTALLPCGLSLRDNNNISRRQLYQQDCIPTEQPGSNIPISDPAPKQKENHLHTKPLHSLPCPNVSLRNPTKHGPNLSAFLSACKLRSSETLKNKGDYQ